MRIRFAKMHGAGNDFVMIDDRDGTFPAGDAAFIAKLANRPDGIGCEGVILVRPPSARLQPSASSLQPSFSMRFFNPDGSEADMCGNGARCVAAFARSIGAAPDGAMRFETRAGVVSAEVLGDGRVRIALPDPKDLRENFVNSGVPHAIVPVGDLAAVDVAGEGRRIRRSRDFAPDGTNVDFVKWTGPSSLSIRTYERGVEAETFACGTGSVAAALVGVAQYGLRFPVTVTTVCGHELEIGGTWKGESFSDVTLTGPVKTVFDGEIELGDASDTVVRSGAKTSPCAVMGVVNVTPDSFSDGGKFFRPEEAIRRARNMIEEGASVIDLGGESTRPGATPLGWEEEWSRLEPVLAGLKCATARNILLSVDTYHPETAERALKAGANIINCVRAEPIPEMLALLDRHPAAELVVPFRISPSSSGARPPAAYLPRLYLDPMIGFGTTREEDLELLRSIPELAKRGRVLVGASRKRIVKRLTGEKVAGKDLAGNLTVALWAASNGASVVRVHDVRETVQALKVLAAVESGSVGR